MGRTRQIVGCNWCEKRDLNPYGVNHTPLKRARLPVPPLSHDVWLSMRVFLDNDIDYTRFWKNCQGVFEKYFFFFSQSQIPAYQNKNHVKLTLPSPYVLNPDKTTLYSPPPFDKISALSVI